MNDLSNFKISEFPLNELKWSKDLLFFEGPLLSEYKSRDSQVYLKYWCDCNESFNRWIYFKVSEQDRLRLVLGESSIREVMINQPESFLFITDENADVVNTYMVSNNLIPETYIPSDNSYLDISEYLGDENITSMVFEDEWNIDSLKVLYRKFSQVFDFIYVSKNRSLNSSTLPWKGGFSSVHFYNTLASFVPKNKSCSLNAVHYASPGYMKIKCNSDSSSEALKSINDYIHNETHISELYNSLQGRFRSLELNHKSSELDAVNAFDSDSECIRFYEQLSQSLLGDNVGWLNDGFGNNFVRAKIIMAHKRRLESFSEFIKDKSVRVVSDIFSQ